MGLCTEVLRQKGCSAHCDPIRSREVNEQCVLSCLAVCLRHVVFIYLLMEIQASLAGRAEKQHLVFQRRWLASSRLGIGLDQAF